MSPFEAIGVRTVIISLAIYAYGGGGRGLLVAHNSARTHYVFMCVLMRLYVELLADSYACDSQTDGKFW